MQQSKEQTATENKSLHTKGATFTEVFEAAKAKGYNPILCHIAKYGSSAALPHATTNEASQVCELALIQKWLRETKGIKVFNTGMSYKICGSNFATINSHHFAFRSFEDALLAGIKEALKKATE